MNKKNIIVFAVLFCFLLVATILFINYYTEYHDLKHLIESELRETNEKKNQYEAILLKYDLMDFKIFAFEKRHSQFAKIVAKAFEEAQKNDLSPYTVLSVIQVESNFDPTASSGIADGLMQINLKAWKEYFNIDEKKIYDIDYNIAIGCKILRHYLDESKGNLSRALYLYNNGYGFHNKKYVPKVQDNTFAQKNK